MLTQHIDDLRERGNQRCEGARTRNEPPEKAAFQTDAHSGEMLQIQPRTSPSSGESRGMQCTQARVASA